jgi:hypothetical protein
MTETADANIGLYRFGHDPYSCGESERVRQDITRRLQFICSGFSADDFGALIEKMVHEQIRGEIVGYRA